MPVVYICMQERCGARWRDWDIFGGNHPCVRVLCPAYNNIVFNTPELERLVDKYYPANAVNGVTDTVRCSSS